MLRFLVYLFLIATPLWPSYAGFKLPGMLLLNPQRLLAMMIAASLAAGLLLSRDLRVRLRQRLADNKLPMLLMFGLFGWRIISVANAANVLYAAFMVSLAVLQEFITFLAVAVALDSYESLRKAVRFLLYGAVIVSVTSSVEALVETNLYARFVPQSAASDEYVVLAMADKIRGTYRVQGPFLHPLVLAQYFILLLPIACFCAFSRTVRFAARAPLFLFMVLGVYVLWRTGSRAGVLLLGGQIALFGVVDGLLTARNLKSPVRLLGVLIMTGVALLATPVLLDQANSLLAGGSRTESQSTQARFDQFQSGIRSILEKPILGWGPGTATEHASTADYNTRLRSVDNYYLTLVVESGIPALAALVSMLIAFAFLALRLGRTAPPGYSGLAQSVFYSFVGFFSFASVLSTHEVFPFAYALFGMLCVLNSLVLRSKDFT